MLRWTLSVHLNILQAVGYFCKCSDVCSLFLFSLSNHLSFAAPTWTGEKVLFVVFLALLPLVCNHSKPTSVLFLAIPPCVCNDSEMPVAVYFFVISSLLTNGK